MGEMLTYIFSSLRSSEKRLDVVTRAVSKQRSFNKQITIFAALTTANLVVMKIEQSDSRHCDRSKHRNDRASKHALRNRP